MLEIIFKDYFYYISFREGAIIVSLIMFIGTSIYLNHIKDYVVSDNRIDTIKLIKRYSFILAAVSVICTFAFHYMENQYSILQSCINEEEWIKANNQLEYIKTLKKYERLGGTECTKYDRENMEEYIFKPYMYQLGYDAEVLGEFDIALMYFDHCKDYKDTSDHIHYCFQMELKKEEIIKERGMDK